MRMGARLALFFIVIMALAVVLLSWAYTENASTAISERTDAQLASIGLLKIGQLDDYKTQEASHLGRIADRLASSGNADNESALRRELAAQTDFDMLFVMDPSGTIVASTDASQDGKNVSNESYFSGGLTGKGFMSQFYPPGSGRQPAYFSATPIKDGSGRTVAVLGARTGLNEISALMLEPAGMGMSGEVFLTDNYGVPITALKKTRINNSTGPLKTLAVLECLRGNNGSATYPDYHGDQVIVRYFWLQDNDMCLISKIDSSEALMPIEQVNGEVMLIAAVLLLGFAVVAIMVVRKLLSPIDELTRVVSAISKGDMGSEVDPRLKESADEIGKLARAFDRTLVSLKLAMRETTPELKIESRALKEALAERIKAEQRYRALIKTSPDAVIVTDPAGIINEVSSRTLELFGADNAAELLGRDSYELLPAEARKAARKAITETLEISGQMNGVKLTMQRKDGSTFTGEVNIKRLKDAADKHIGTILTLRDITRRETEDRVLREALEERRKAEERYKALVETAPMATTVVDIGGNITEVSEQTLKLHGYESASEVIGRSAYDLIVPEDREKAREIAIKTSKAGHLEGVRYTMLRKDGSRFLGELNVRALKSAGKIYGFIGSTTDITKREAKDEALRTALAKADKAEKQLEGERDLMKRYLDVADVMMVAIGTDQKVTLINRKGCEVLGYKESEIVGKNWFDTFIPKSEAERTKATFKKLMSGEIKEVEYYENAILCRNGQEKLMAWRNTTLHDDGRIIGTLSSGEDITQRRMTEGRLKTMGRLCTMSDEMRLMAGDVQRKDLSMETAFADLCRILVETGGFRMAWVGMVDAGTRRVMPVAHAGMEKGYLDSIKITIDDVPEGQGPTGTAIRENRAIIIDDWAKDPRMKPWHAAGTKRGYRSSIAIPLQKEGKPVGALNVYSDKTGFFDHETVRALEVAVEMVATPAIMLKTSKKK